MSSVSVLPRTQSADLVAGRQLGVLGDWGACDA